MFMEVMEGVVEASAEAVLFMWLAVEKVESMGEVLRMWEWILAWVSEWERMLQVVAISLVL